METVYDWVTVGLFAGLIVLFLQRSLAEEPAETEPPLLAYLVAGVGCAVTNYLGNNGWDVAAIALLLITVGYSIYFLRPFKWWPSPPKAK